MIGIGELIGQPDPARYRSARGGDQLCDAVDIGAIGLRGGDQHDLAIAQGTRDHSRRHGGIEVACRVEFLVEGVLVLIQVLNLPLLGALVVTQTGQQGVVEQTGTEYDAHRECEENRSEGYCVLAQGNHG